MKAQKGCVSGGCRGTYQQVPHVATVGRTVHEEHFVGSQLRWIGLLTPPCPGLVLAVEIGILPGVILPRPTAIGRSMHVSTHAVGQPWHMAESCKQGTPERRSAVAHVRL